MLGRTTKALSIALIVISISFTATAQKVSFPEGDNNVYWKDAQPADDTDNIREFTAKCGASSEVNTIKVADGSISERVSFNSSSVPIHNNDIEGLENSATTTVTVTCDNAESSEPRELRIASLKASIQGQVGKYEGTDFGVGEKALESDPSFEAPALKLNASVGNDNKVPEPEEVTIDGKFEPRKETVSEESNGYRSIRLYPGGEQSEDFSYRFEVAFDPSGTQGQKITLTEDEATSDGKTPEVTIFDDYRVTEISSSLPKGSFQTYQKLTDLEYEFRLTRLGEPVTPSPSNEATPIRKGFIFTTVETVEDVGEEGSEYAEYVQKNWFSQPQYQEDGRWNTSLDTSPVLEAGLYRFETDFVHRKQDIDQRLGEVFIQRNMDFNGKVVDSSSSRNSIDATFRFFDGGTKENDFSTSPDGTYTSRVERKDYDSVEMGFYDERSRSSATESFDARVTASDVTVGDSQGSVRFDYFRDPSVSIPGISPVNMMAAQFGYDLGDVSEIEMAYDSGSVSVGEAQVFECSNWNYFARSCQSEWERLDEDDYDVNPVSEQVSITGAEPYVLPEDLSGSRNSQRILKNAYVVGTSSGLRLDGDINVGARDGRVPVNSEFSVSGTVVTAGGSAAEGADVSVNLSVGDEEYGSATGETDANGRFSVDLQAPENPGNYSVSVSAEKQPYESFSKVFDRSLTTYVDTGVEVSVDGAEEGQLSLVKGRRTTEDVEIANTGQRPVEDLSVSVSNLDEDFFNLSSGSIDEVGAGDSTSIDLEIMIPESFALNQFPSFTVSADGVSNGEEVSSSTELFTVVNTLSDQNRSDDEANTGPADGGTSRDTDMGNSTDGLGSFLTSAPRSVPGGSATADFVEDTSDANLVLGLLFVLLLVVAAAVKKNSDDSSRAGRDRISHDRPAVTSVKGGSATSQPGVSAAPDSSEEGSPDTVDSEPRAAGSADGAVCDECGDEFDTAVALEMHRETAH